MTEIQITPKWKDVKPEGFYVYVHRKYTCGTAFYVGKGSYDRAYSHWGRPAHWCRVAGKYGATVDIVKDGMSEACAYTYEKIIIAGYGIENLINVTTGGDGCVLANRKPVYCSNGLAFDSLMGAERWVASNTDYTNANGTNISRAAKIDGSSAYGLGWSFKPDVVVDVKPLGYDKRKPVVNNIGMEFASISDAVIWLKTQGHSKATTGGVSASCSGKSGSAYGYTWSYIGEPIKKYVSKGENVAKSQGKQVVCSNGIIFDNLNDAVDWLIGLGRQNASKQNISAAALGKIRSAYGYTWAYLP